MILKRNVECEKKERMAGAETNERRIRDISFLVDLFKMSY